jgi:CopG family nickel-responsive transcriptional regulator
MAEITRFGTSIDTDLLRKFDELISRRRYISRSEAIRDLIRERLVQEECENEATEVLGTVSLVYDHTTRELSDLLTRMQHQYYKSIVSSIHVHINEHYCLEVLIMRGNAKEIKNMAEYLIGARGVKHGKISLTTTGEGLE